MNVFLTTDAFPPGSGGSGRSTAVLASALVRRGHRVRVAVARTKSLGQREWKGVEVAEVEIPEASFGNARRREATFAEGMTLAAGEEAWDVVHAQHWLSAGASRRALPRLPLVVTVRDYWPVCIWSTRMSGREPCPGCSYSRRVVCVGRRKPWLWPVAPLLPPAVGLELRRRRGVLDEAKAVVAVSGYVASTLPAETSPRLHVIPNVVEEPEAERLERPRGVPERYVFFAGKLEPGKAPDRLRDVLEHSGAKLPLLVAGTGSLEAEIRRRGDVRCLGWVDEERLLALMQHADAVLFPSRWQEPLSRVLLDGIRVGAVLVVEPTGGTAEIVVDGESGLHGRGEAGLGSALARVLSDDALARRLREGARKRAASVFSEAAVLPRVESLYRSVAGP
jgi:glycosyltransferase involved in cell wall biosynthesis